MRDDGRTSSALRPVTIERNYTSNPQGSVLITFGNTRVLCTATLTEGVPAFLRDSGQGWVTAEYAMLPGSASGGRIGRNSSTKGRALEISRLIGRSLRSVIDLKALGEHTIILDCDVIQADGGTRTAAITGAFVALHDAVAAILRKNPDQSTPISNHCAAVSVGIVGGEVLLDLCYTEDSSADVDLNLVMLDDGTIIEVQGTAEGKAFDRALLDRMLDVGHAGIEELFKLQRDALAL